MRAWAFRSEIPPEAHRKYLEGLGFSQESRFEDAEAAFTAAIRRAPTFVDAYAELGIVCLKVNKTTSAIQALRAVAELDPLRPHVYCQLSDAYLRNYDPMTAKAHLDAALARDPGCGHAHYIMGEWYRRKAHFSKAITEFEKAATLMPGTEEPLVRIADICLMPAIRHLDQAESALRRARSVASNHPLVALGWGKLWAQRPATHENLTRAYEALSSAMRSSPNLQEGFTELGLICEKMGNTDEALTHYRRALELYSNDKTAHSRIARLLLRLDKSHEAEKHLDAVRNLETAEEEVRHWQARLEPGRDNSDARLHLAALYKQLGLIDRAEAQLQLALHEQPDNREASRELSRLREKR